MRLRMKKYHAPYNPGEVVEVENSVAYDWLRLGIAMEDKSLDGAKEVKAQEPKESKEQKSGGAHESAIKGKPGRPG